MAEFGQIMPSYPDPSVPKEKSENAAASVFETAHAAAPSPNTQTVARSEGSRIFCGVSAQSTRAFPASPPSIHARAVASA